MDFFVVILSLTVQINLPLKTGHFFASGQTYKISRGSIFFLSPLYVNTYAPYLI